MTKIVKVLVPISGGKDSQACLKLALQHYQPDEVRGLFCDTQFEHGLTYEHIETMRALYGVQIERITAGSVEEQCLKHKRFPADNARFCTKELKIVPTKNYCAQLAKRQWAGFEVWYGMRAEESHDRATRYAGKVCDEVYPPHEVITNYPKYLAHRGVMFRLAILDWSEKDVLDFLDGAENPLYAAGFGRVGCFPCLASGDRWKAKAFNHDEFGHAQHAKVIKIGKQIGKDVWTSKSGKAAAACTAANDNGPGCAVCAI